MRGNLLLLLIYYEGGKNTKKRFDLFILVIGLMIITLILLNKNIIAKYLEEHRTKGSAQIAIPVFVVEGDQNIKIDQDNPQKEYTFSIKNYTEEKVNDVEFQYAIYLESDIDDKIDIQLEKNKKALEFKNNKIEKITMEAGKKIEHVYHLKIETKENYDEIIGNITIKVLATQVK